MRASLIKRAFSYVWITLSWIRTRFIIELIHSRDMWFTIPSIQGKKNFKIVASMERSCDYQANILRSKVRIWKFTFKKRHLFHVSFFCIFECKILSFIDNTCMSRERVSERVSERKNKRANKRAHCFFPRVRLLVEDVVEFHSKFDNWR